MKKTIGIIALSFFALSSSFSEAQNSTKKNAITIEIPSLNTHFLNQNALAYYDLQSFPSIGLSISYQRLLSDSSSKFFSWYDTYLSLGLNSTTRAGIINLNTEQVHVTTQYFDVPLKLSLTSSNKAPLKVLMAVGINLGIPYEQTLNSSIANSTANNLIKSCSGTYNLGYIADFGFLYKMNRFNSFVTLRTISDFKTTYYKYFSQGINFGVQVPF